MSRRFELLVFDWDGTLMDSAAIIVESLQAACADLSLPVPAEADARHIIGLGLEDALGYLFPSLPRNRYGALAERYRFHFLARDNGIPLFPGVSEAIRELHREGFLLAVATGKSRVGLDRALESTGLRLYFHASRCADEGFPKPHPEMLLALMAELGTAPEQTLMIGDTSYDLQMAANAGVAAIAAAYGAHPRASLLACSALACLESFAELHRWLKIHA